METPINRLRGMTTQTHLPNQIDVVLNNCLKWLEVSLAEQDTENPHDAGQPREQSNPAEAIMAGQSPHLLLQGSETVIPILSMKIAIPSQQKHANLIGTIKRHRKVWEIQTVWTWTSSTMGVHHIMWLKRNPCQKWVPTEVTKAQWHCKHWSRLAHVHDGKTSILSQERLAVAIKLRQAVAKKLRCGGWSLPCESYKAECQIQSGAKWGRGICQTDTPTTS